MGTVKLEDIIGYGINGKNVCVNCVTVEERNKSNELNYILESEMDFSHRNEGIICDRCGKELIYGEQPSMDP
ncbi:unnamed protein product [marine sediment metagenome]|uniref:Uncharacterized protein n=1 Tax=marine sediment metagenome TaxID=412755 RepID=X1N107_9ZZZZ